MFRKILCPVDFSLGSQQAMSVAVRLATAGDGELVLAHSWYLPPLAYGGEIGIPAGTIDSMIADEENALARAVRDATELGAKRVTSMFLTGQPAERLCDQLEADSAFDLVVMGTHGRSGLGRILLGSVAEKVVRHSPCSVLAVRGRNGTAAFRHVLCPIDFSAQSRLAMTLAGELAAKDGLGVTLLHVLELPVRFSGEPTAPGFLEDLDRRAARMLDDWCEELRARFPVPVVGRTRIGSPGAQTLSVLDGETTFELVVVGSHGRTGIARALLGSVAEKIVRHAPCPVFVARARTPVA